MSKNIAPNPAPGSVAPGAGSAVNASGAPSKNMKTMPRKNTQAGDPAPQPLGKHPYAPYERNGAKYGIQVGFEAHTAPEAGLTQANGRIMPHAVNRSSINFRNGMGA